MPLPKNRSTSMRKIHVRTPKRGHTIHYKRRVKGNVHSCGITGERLQGVHSRQGKAASNKVPNRKFGGNLSSSVSSRVIKFATRVKEGSMKLEDVDVRLLSHVKGLLAKK
ncbi:MAG: 50S ribosomal protein L34e [Candidatus Micrarchaeia archaeon]|jgi:ribosomal protein L34E